MQEEGFKPDLIHIHVRSHITKIALDFLIKGSVPIVISEHFSYYHRGINMLPLKEQKAERKSIRDQFSAKVVKHILPVSKDLEQKLRSEFSVKNVFSVIPNIASKEFLHPVSQPRLEHNFVACGFWSEPKDPLTMLKALAKTKDNLPNAFHLDVIGDGELLPEMKSFCAENLQGVSIVFHGYQSKAFIAKKLQSSIGLLHPTKMENLPTIIIESLVSGCPVISMNVNGIPELISSNNGILVQPGDVSGFSTAIEKLMNQPFDFHIIANEANAHFSPEMVGERLQKIFMDAVNAGFENRA